MRHIVAFAKIPATMEFLSDFIEQTERKIVIFHHHIDVGEILVDECKKKFPDVPVIHIVSVTIRKYGTQKLQNLTIPQAR